MGLLEDLQAEKAAYLLKHGMPAQSPVMKPSPWMGAMPTPSPIYPPGKAPIPMDEDAASQVIKSFNSVR